MTTETGTEDHRLICFAVEIAKENLADEGRIDLDAILSKADDAAQDRLILDTAAGYVEAGMTTCTCR